MRPADRVEYLATVPTSARGILERAFAGKASPRAAIKAQCLACSCFDRAEVTLCPVTLCPLHPYRPFQDTRNLSKSARADEFSAEAGPGRGAA